MANIELTAVLRKPQAEIFTFLEDLSNYRQFLPQEAFDRFRSGDAVGGRNSATLRWHTLGRWWPSELELDTVSAPEHLVIRSTKCRLPFTWTWTLKELRKDRKGEKTEVHLNVDVQVPGGRIGRFISGKAIEGNLLKVYDALLRNLESALGATPRSGLRAR